MSEEWLTLRLTSLKGDVSAEAFIDALRDTLAVLNEINKAASDYGSANIEWRVVDAGRNSPPLFAKLRPFPALPKADLGDLGERVIAGFVSGLLALESIATPPPLFNEDALRLVASLDKVRSRSVSAIEYLTESRTAAATRTVAKHATEAANRLELERAQKSGKYVEYGSIEGQLQGLDSQQRRDRITITDSLTGEKTLCYFRDSELEQKARKNWKRRVAVYGEIVVDRFTGEPEEMTVRDIVPLRTRDELPQIDDLRAIDITGGIESSEYVRGLRDGD